MMPEKKFVLQTLPLPDILHNLPEDTNRVLLIRCAPEKIINYCVESLRNWQPDAEIYLLCHEGGEVPGCRSIIYHHNGFFKLERVDQQVLQKEYFDIVVLPYASTQRLLPYYHNVDEIAEAAATDTIVFVYQDGTALTVDREFMDRKKQEVVKPYLERKRKTIEEISEYTGEPVSIIEEKCDMAGIEATRVWMDSDPKTEREVREYYSGHDFYIYELMKTEYKNDRGELLEAVLEECSSGEKILDYGGGCGIFSIPLAEKGALVTHLDLPGPLLEFAAWRFRRRNLPVTILQAENETPLKEQYDTIVSIYVIEHLVNPELTLHHLAEHIKPEGKLILAVDYEEGRCCDGPLPLHLTHISRERYYQFMESLGLEVVKNPGNLGVFKFKQ